MRRDCGRASTTTASRKARVSAPEEIRNIQPLASVLRIALFLFKLSAGCSPD
jgi:hypothetical protein